MEEGLRGPTYVSLHLPFLFVPICIYRPSHSPLSLFLITPNFSFFCELALIFILQPHSYEALCDDASTVGVNSGEFIYFSHKKSDFLVQKATLNQIAH